MEKAPLNVNYVDQTTRTMARAQVQALSRDLKRMEKRPKDEKRFSIIFAMKTVAKNMFGM